MTELRTPVLIVGSGLAGLTTALMLAWRGVPALLIERHAGTSKNPRARGVNARSMELLRVAGVEEELVAAAGHSFSDFRIVVAESVTGRELRTLLPPGGAGMDTSAISPARPSAAGQDRVEPILARHAQALGAELRYSTELLSFQQDADGVDALIVDCRSGREERVRADYLVAADGHRSPIGERLGIGAHGHGVLSNNVAIVFEGDIEALIGERAFALYYLQSPAFTGAFVNTDDPGRALVSVEYDPQRSPPESFDEARCLQIVRAALGAAQFDARIVEINHWEMSSRVADEFSRGRVFLVGDAAHTMPPTGGLGGQTAIQDGYDLAWKLAMVLHGDAGPGLLDTYAAERQPVAQITVARQTANYVERLRPDRTALSQPASSSSGGGGAQGIPDHLEVAMGYRYRSAALSLEQSDDTGAAENPFSPSGRPGTRVPHLRLKHRGVQLSPWDLIGREFVLLCGVRGDQWASAARAIQFEAGVPLCVYRLGSELLDVEGAWTARMGIAAGGALLLRPDGYIAWRARESSAAPHAELREVLARALCRALRSLRARSTAAWRSEVATA